MADYGPLEPSNRLEWFLANGGGNGGSGGDAETFEVTLTNNYETAFELYFPNLSSVGSDNFIVSVFDLPGESTVTAEVPLIANYPVLLVSYSEQYTSAFRVAGNISYSNTLHCFIISGEGSIEWGVVG